MSVHVEPSGAALGATVHGLDLSLESPDTIYETLKPAIRDHSVVCVPAQNVDAKTLAALSRRFGVIERHLLDQFHHPEDPDVLVLSNARDGERAIGFSTPEDPEWHSDLSYRPRPTHLSFLYAVRVPAEGGDTLFASMIRACAELDPSLRRRLVGLRAVHNYENRTRRLSEAQRSNSHDVSHPVLRRHPWTGEPTIFINPTFTSRIEGVEEAEGVELMRTVFAHCMQPRFQYRHRWRPGDLVIWDNAAVWHAATPPVYREERTLFRTTVTGDEPAAA